MQTLNRSFILSKSKWVYAGNAPITDPGSHNHRSQIFIIPWHRKKKTPKTDSCTTARTQSKQKQAVLSLSQHCLRIFNHRQFLDLPKQEAVKTNNFSAFLVIKRAQEHNIEPVTYIIYFTDWTFLAQQSRRLRMSL